MNPILITPELLGESARTIMIPEGYFFCPYSVLWLFIGGAFIIGAFIGIAAYIRHNGGNIFYDIFGFFNRIK